MRKISHNIDTQKMREIASETRFGPKYGPRTDKQTDVYALQYVTYLVQTWVQVRR